MVEPSPTPQGLTPDGLTDAAAKTLLASEGYNELPQAHGRSFFRIVLGVVKEPMLALLIGGGVIYFALGSAQEGIILLIFALLSVAITVVQEARTERVLDALRDLTSPRALVIRGGVRQRIAGREVARGDLIVLAEGDRVPADARLVQATDLLVDESLLTGESVPVRKLQAQGDVPVARPGGEDLPFVFSGSLVVRGQALGQVVATGVTSEIGKIGKSLALLDSEAPHLQAQMRKLVVLFAALGGVVSVAVVVLYGLLRGGWLEALLAGIAVGMSMLPEEFPVVLAVFMAMGAWRISQARVLTRRASAIETLGSATVLCTDKTGTLTENRMTIAQLRLADGAEVAVTDAPLTDGFADLLTTGVLASAAVPVDPMEKAFAVLAGANAKEQPTAGRNLLKSYPLRPDLLAMSQVWSAGKGEAVVAAKGAPEAIAELCRLDPAAQKAMALAVDQMAAAGLRVLGVARASVPDGDLPQDQPGFSYQFLGLVGLADPLRASVPAAVAECKAAGIRVVMITGDYPATAQAIARAAGIPGDDVVSGADLAAMSDADLAARMRTALVFARILPEQKLRIVTALKADGEVVAMTGDGVNDAPSLKAAHIGVAMGGRGTDVAREAASIVLLDDDFGSIVTTIRLGRRIYDNIRKAMSFIFAVHVPIAGLALMPLVFGLPILFGPMHIAFLEMVIDPVCSLVFEAETEEDGVMRRNPRRKDEPLFATSTIVWSMLQGALAFAAVATIFVLSLENGLAEDQARALTFVSLIGAIVALIFVNRSVSASILTAIVRPNRALAIVLPVVAIMLAVTLMVPFARGLFRFGALEPAMLVVPIATAAGLLVLLELIKPVWRWGFGERNRLQEDRMTAQPLPPETTPAATAVVTTAPATPVAPVPKSRPMPWKRLGLAALVALGLGALAWWQPWMARMPQVVIETVTPGPVSRILAVNGRIAALHSVGVRAAVPGQVTEVTVATGDAVAAGGVIAQLDAAQPRAQAMQALAAFDASVVRRQQAQADADRARALGGNIPRNTLEAAELAATTAGNEVDRLQAALAQAQSQLALYTITAPLSGTVLARDVEPGQVVDGVAVLFIVADAQALVIEADIDETYATRMQPGLSVQLQLTGDAAILPGTVTYVAPVVDPDTGGLSIKITPDTPRAAPIGLTVTANIVMDTKPIGITAPRSAILTEAETSVLFVVVDGKAERRVVTVVPWPAVRLEVTEGLAAGDALIVDPTGLTDGQAVEIAQP